MRRLIWLGLVLCLWASGAAAQAPLRALQTADDARGWEAVGRLELGQRGFCTGTLIAPDLVLTAAHCLYRAETGALIALSEISFLAGLRNGRPEAQRGIRRAVLHPGYDYDDPDRMARVAHDLALLQLQRPIRLPGVVPFAADGDLRKGDRVDVVSYARQRAQAPSLEQACRVMARRPAMVVLSCQVDFGASGAPVFRRDGGMTRIVSVVSAKAEGGGQPVSLGPRLGGDVAMLQARLAAGQDVIGTEVPPIHRFGQGSARGPDGAKFLRP